MKKGSNKFASFIQNIIKDDTPKQPKKQNKVAEVEPADGLPFTAAPIGGGGDADLLQMLNSGVTSLTAPESKSNILLGKQEVSVAELARQMKRKQGIAEKEAQKP